MAGGGQKVQTRGDEVGWGMPVVTWVSDGAHPLQQSETYLGQTCHCWSWWGWQWWWGGWCCCQWWRWQYEDEDVEKNQYSEKCMSSTPKQDKEMLFLLRTFHQQPNCERVNKKVQYFEMRIATFCGNCIKILNYKSLGLQAFPYFSKNNNLLC